MRLGDVLRIADQDHSGPFLAEEPHGELDYPPEFRRAPLLLKASFGLSGRASTTQTFVLVDGADTTDTRVGALALIVHERDRMTATANFDVRCNNVSLSPEDPDVVMLESARTVGQSSVIFGTIPAAGPFLEVIPLAQPVGPQLRVSLVFRQGISDVADVQTITLSLYLVTRTRE